MNRPHLVKCRYLGLYLPSYQVVTNFGSIGIFDFRWHGMSSPSYKKIDIYYSPQEINYQSCLTDAFKIYSIGEDFNLILD